jgi:hypothetical protein
MFRSGQGRMAEMDRRGLTLILTFVLLVSIGGIYYELHNQKSPPVVPEKAGEWNCNINNFALISADALVYAKPGDANPYLKLKSGNIVEVVEKRYQALTLYNIEEWLKLNSRALGVPDAEVWIIDNGNVDSLLCFPTK